MLNQLSHTGQGINLWVLFENCYNQIAKVNLRWRSWCILCYHNFVRKVMPPPQREVNIWLIFLSLAVCDMNFLECKKIIYVHALKFSFQHSYLIKSFFSYLYLQYYSNFKLITLCGLFLLPTSPWLIRTYYKFKYCIISIYNILWIILNKILLGNFREGS